MAQKHDIIIIGAGVVGCAIARELSKYQVKVLVLEKEGDVAEGISKANSGVLHAGFNVPTGSLKAKLNVEGLNYFPQLAKQLDIPYVLSKKLVVANDEDELDCLRKLLDQGIINGCEGLSIIGKDKIDKIQPGLSAKYALYSEKTAIVSPFEMSVAFAENAHANGVQFKFYAEVVDIIKENDEAFLVKLQNGKEFTTKIVINAAGCWADKIAAMVEPHSNTVYPVRGEYYILDCDNGDILKTCVYPAPRCDGRGLGIHLTPTINNNILIGPSAEYVDEKNDVANSYEVTQKLLKEAHELLPGLKNISFITSFAGIRPKLVAPDDEANFRDFVIEEAKSEPNFINLIGIESPGLTSAPAIGRYVVDELVANKINLAKKGNFISHRQGMLRVKFMGANELKDRIEQDKNYGEIVCRCERVTRAEILQAAKNPLGVKTLNGIKRRSHAMMGRCQGGFCVPKICKILMDDCGLRFDEVVKNSKGSWMLNGGVAS